MGVVRKSLTEVRSTKPSVDLDRIAGTNEEDIRRHQLEDGEDPDRVLTLEESISPQAIRKRLRMTQEQFATALRVPLATLRNWEQGRVFPDPAARSLLKLVARDPEQMLKRLAD